MTSEQEATIVRYLEIVRNIINHEKLMMEQNGFVIDNLDNRWQKLAFTLYTDILGLSTQAEHILEYLEEDLPESMERE